ncbi:unnamed protein product [Cochlearia groenlandica]
MMIGENYRQHPTIHIPQWDPINDPTATISPVNLINGGNDSPSFLDSFASLFRYLPSNDSDGDDEFHMYDFKVRRCSRGRSHDWTECPFVHPGEKARRRDPRKFRYSGTACPEFRKGSCCRRGDSCDFAHGVFECWLHPCRYRTQPCKDGTSCRRRICFFAHTPQQLRVSDLGFSSILVSPPISPPSESPPISPTSGELIASLRKMDLNGGSWNSSPMRSDLRLPFASSMGRSWPPLKRFGVWEDSGEEIPAMEVVESGKEIRAKMYARLSRENSLG